jgi:uncharacterized protein YecE (DUF72 family)
MAQTGKVRIGVSGWVYPPWRGTFYPKTLPQSEQLAYVGRTFITNEINTTFYRTHKPETFRRWAATVPAGFQFAVKGPRYITHILRLKEPTTALANFFATGVLKLGPKLGPILWQLPPSFKFDARRIDDFLALLPHDTLAAVKLAKKHDDKIKHTWLRTDKKRRIRHALEIRHDSFITPEFTAILRKRRVALVCADTVKWPYLVDLTADFVYGRLHGSDKLYFSNYSPQALARWAQRVAAWARGEDPAGPHADPRHKSVRSKRDVYLYFDNTEKVYAPENALNLEKRVLKKLSKP